MPHGSGKFSGQRPDLDQNRREAGVDPRLQGSHTTGPVDGFEQVIEATQARGHIPCFTTSALIATPQGERRVDQLRPGDRIFTRDNGLQEICWIGHCDLSTRDLYTTPELGPILIKAGSLGDGMPARDMVVSPNHRILVTGKRSSALFGDPETLVSARHLVGMEGVSRISARRLTYVHFMFERHEVVLSNGAWTESFHPNQDVLGGIGQEQRDEIYSLFPELKTQTGLDAYKCARRELKLDELRLFAAE